MKIASLQLLSGVVLLVTVLAQITYAATIFERTTVYHHIRVVDQGDSRILFFDDAQQTRMSLRNPADGHFEYTEYFHMPWLWNDKLRNVLMIGLGGGSAQRAFEQFYPEVVIDTVEIDPIVVRVARNYFNFHESPRQRVYVEDGRVFLRRTRTCYDLLVVDAYVSSRYGPAIPAHLATKEFFALAAARLSTNGVLAYNVVGTLHGYQRNLVGSIYKTMKTVFPQVYLFTATSSFNVVLLGTKNSEKMTPTQLKQRADALLNIHPQLPPWFMKCLSAFHAEPPTNLATCPVLTDDFAPVEGLARGRQ